VRGRGYFCFHFLSLERKTTELLAAGCSCSIPSYPLVSLSSFPPVYTIKRSSCYVRRPSVSSPLTLCSPFFLVLFAQSFRAPSGQGRRYQRPVFIPRSFSPHSFFYYHRSRPRMQNHARRIREYATSLPTIFPIRSNPPRLTSVPPRSQ
jgi:hypothetical protein